MKHAYEKFGVSDVSVVQKLLFERITPELMGKYQEAFSSHVPSNLAESVLLLKSSGVLPEEVSSKPPQETPTSISGGGMRC